MLMLHDIIKHERQITAMSSVAKTYYTPEEYLALERKAEYKSEYINGQIFAMSGASRDHGLITRASREHNLIAGNLFGELRARLRGRPCEAYVSDMRVKVHPTGLYTYPDVVITCGEPIFEDRQLDTLTNPTVIIEVLSRSTEAYDRGEKFAHYRRLESLTDYVLVAQDKVRVEHFVRYSPPIDKGDRDIAGRIHGTHGLWVLAELDELEGPDGTLQLSSIGCSLILRDIYERVEFPDNSAASPGG